MSCGINRRPSVAEATEATELLSDALPPDASPVPNGLEKADDGGASKISAPTVFKLPNPLTSR